MAPRPSFARIALVLTAACAPLLAQTPLFTDGTVFGGSKVFSEGLNPLGNPARTPKATDGYYFTYLDGDQEAKDAESSIDNSSSTDPSTASSALVKLGNSPWALRTRAYGLVAIKQGTSLALTHEELTGILATPDLTPADLGNPGVANNTSLLDVRRANVTRLNVGGGSQAQQGMTLGGNMRIERWSMGEQRLSYNNPGPNFGSTSSTLLGFSGSSPDTYTYGIDLGMAMELAQGVRLGLTADQINAKRLWDVDLKPQARAGLQIDLGQWAMVTVESDLNSAERMPFPVKQQATAGSIRFSLNPSVVLLVGAEQRKIDDASVTRGGATLQIRTQSLLLSLGFQAGQDRPMKSATVGFF